MKRQQREDRRRGVEVRLQPRDVELLHALARLRIARTDDLAGFCFAGVRRDTVAERLRKLFDAGYLNVSAPERSVPNLYSLGPRGRKLVAESGEEVSPVPRGSLEHHLGIVRTWVGLSSCPVRDVSLELARPDWEIRAEFGDRGLPLVPDLFAVLAFSGTNVALAVEVDLGTEPLHVLLAKVRAYAELSASSSGLFGWRRFALAMVLGDARRQADIDALLRAEWAGCCFVWTLEEGCSTAIGQLALALKAPLTGTPYSKGRCAALSDYTASHARDEQRGL